MTDSVRSRLRTKHGINELCQAFNLYAQVKMTEAHLPVEPPESWLEKRYQMSKEWKEEKFNGSAYCTYMEFMFKTYGDFDDQMIKKIIASSKMKGYTKSIATIIKLSQAHIADPTLSSLIFSTQL